MKRLFALLVCCGCLAALWVLPVSAETGPPYTLEEFNEVFKGVAGVESGPFTFGDTIEGPMYTYDLFAQSDATLAAYGARFMEFMKRESANPNPWVEVWDEPRTDDQGREWWLYARGEERLMSIRDYDIWRFVVGRVPGGAAQEQPPPTEAPTVQPTPQPAPAPDPTEKPCIMCEGTGKVKCSKCYGSHEIDCNDCNARGYTFEWVKGEREKVDCWTCHGKRRVECKHCDMITGLVTCEYCMGVGASK